MASKDTEAGEVNLDNEPGGEDDCGRCQHLSPIAKMCEKYNVSTGGIGDRRKKCSHCLLDGGHANPNSSIEEKVFFNGVELGSGELTPVTKLSEHGVKFDGGKLPWHLLPTEAVAEVVKVLRCGAKKYAPRNWEKGLLFSQCYSAAQRHLQGCDEHAGWWNRADVDADTRTSHLANAICELMFLLAFELRGMTELDDRPEAKKLLSTGPEKV